MLYQGHTHFFAFLTHAVGPDGGLDLADVSFVKQHHAQTTMTNTSSNAQGQAVVEQLLVEIELLTLLLTLNLELAQQTLFVNTDTH